MSTNLAGFKHHTRTSYFFSLILIKVVTEERKENITRGEANVGESHSRRISFSPYYRSHCNLVSVVFSVVWECGRMKIAPLSACPRACRSLAKRG